MTTPAPVTSLAGAPASAGVRSRTGLHAAAASALLTVTESACWPETSTDTEVKPVPGFIESAFSPLIAEVAGRALRCRAQESADEDRPVTAIVLATALGDVTSAARVAAAVDAGQRVAPLQFFQCVPNAVAGYLAARWHLTGPVVCVSGVAAAVEAAALLLEDADADEALIVNVDLGAASGDGDHAAAIIVTGPDGRPGIHPRERHEHP